jgi:hypothetical protein
MGLLRVAGGVDPLICIEGALRTLAEYCIL